MKHCIEHCKKLAASSHRIAAATLGMAVLATGSFAVPTPTLTQTQTQEQEQAREQSLSSKVLLRYQRSGGITGETARLVVKDDGQVQASLSRSGTSERATGRLSLWQLQALEDAVHEELDRPRIALWDCDQAADEIRHTLQASRDGAFQRLITCDPDPELRDLFAKMRALIERTLDPDVRSLDRSEWYRVALVQGSVARQELQAFRDAGGKPRYVIFGIDAEGAMKVAERGAMDEKSMALLRSLSDGGVCGGGIVHDHRIPPSAASQDAGSTAGSSQGSARPEREPRQPRMFLEAKSAGAKSPDVIHRSLTGPVAWAFLRTLVR